jgi:uncharacterized protein YlxW (UPF0749 family)
LAIQRCDRPGEHEEELKMKDDVLRVIAEPLSAMCAEQDYGTVYPLVFAAMSSLCDGMRIQHEAQMKRSNEIADKYESDWRAAKSEFGNAMAKMREKNRELTALVDSLRAELADSRRNGNHSDCCDECKMIKDGEAAKNSVLPTPPAGKGE